MSLSILFVLGLLVLVSLLLVREKLRPDVMALLVLAVLGLSGIVKADELFTGFSRPAVMTILALFIITAGLERTGVSSFLGRQLIRLAGQSEARAVVVLMLAAALLSLVMNNIAAAAVLLPAVIGLSRHTKLRASRLLMPLAFGTLLGGMATLFTTANLLVSAALQAQNLRPYGVFDFVPVGLPMALAGIGYMALVGRRWLPNYALVGLPERPTSSTLMETYGLREATNAVYVKSTSELAGKTLSAGNWRRRVGVQVMAISRGAAVNLAPAPADKVLPGDIIWYTGRAYPELLAQYDLLPTTDPAWEGQLTDPNLSLVEVILAPRSGLAGKTLCEINFREKFDLTVLAIWREGVTLRERLAETPLRFGDALLMRGPHAKIRLLRSEPDFLVLEEDAPAVESPLKAWLTLGLTTAAILAAAFNLLPLAVAAFAAAGLMLVLNCLSMDEAYRSIDWKTIFIIAGMLPLGLALNSTGAAALLGELVVRGVGGLGPLAVAGGLYLITLLLTQVIGGQVTPVVLAPIAIATALKIGVEPHWLGLAVALGASTAFISPLSHSVNLLVMGPGGYTFKDYLRVGLPLTVILFAVLLVSLELSRGGF